MKFCQQDRGAGFYRLHVSILEPLLSCISIDRVGDQKEILDSLGFADVSRIGWTCLTWPRESGWDVPDSLFTTPRFLFLQNFKYANKEDSNTYKVKQKQLLVNLGS